MSTLQEIEQAIKRLPRDEAYQLSQWLSARLNAQWDDQFENDVQNGRLDDVARRTIEEHRAGQSRDFPSAQ